MTLSPSGKAVAAVRRVGDIDVLLRIDLADFKAQTLFRTFQPPKVPVSEDLRQTISYVAWKSDSTLLITVLAPANFGEIGIRQIPIHVIVDSQAKIAPLPLNEKGHGRGATADLSWIQDILANDPGHVLIGVQNPFAPAVLYRVDIADGSRVLVEKGTDDVTGFGTDRTGAVVTRTLEHDDGSITLQSRSPGETSWTKIFDFHEHDLRALAKYDLLGLGAPGVLYVSAKPETPADGDTAAIRTFDLRSKTLGPIVWSNPKYDVDSLIQDDTTGGFVAACYWVDTLQCDFKSPVLAANFTGLNKYFGGERNLAIVSKTKDESKWILSVIGPDEPGDYFLYDATAHHLTELGEQWADLSSERLGRMRRFAFKSRDGAELTAYVTEPPGSPKGPLPLVVMPHGGPEDRDDYAYSTWTQFLATRGYVVLQPNFRGSAGYGCKFAEAGYRQWGARMHDDVMDATRALIAEGRVDPKRVCIVGGSYGGYEALYSAAKEAATFRCAVSIDGVSDLTEDVKWEKHFGRTSPRYLYWVKDEGDPDADAARLQAASPIAFVQTWTTPLLLIHGDKDDIVAVDQSRKLRRALEAAGKTVRYVEIRNMGHGPSSVAEQTTVLGEIASFLATNFGPATPAPVAAPAP